MRFVLMRGSKPVAELVPVPSGRRLGDLPALLASLPLLTEDELADFERDLARELQSSPSSYHRRGLSPDHDN